MRYGNLTQSTCRRCGGPVVVRPLGDHGYEQEPGTLKLPTCSFWGIRPQWVTSVLSGQKFLYAYTILRVSGPATSPVVAEAETVKVRGGQPPLPTACPECGAALVEEGDILRCPNSMVRIVPRQATCSACHEGTAHVSGAPGLKD